MADVHPEPPSLEDAVKVAREQVVPNVYEEKMHEKTPAAHRKIRFLSRKAHRTRIKLEKKRRSGTGVKEGGKSPPKFIFDDGGVSAPASSIGNQSGTGSLIRVPPYTDSKSFGLGRGSKIGSKIGRHYYGLSKALQDAASAGSRGSRGSYRKSFQDPPAAILPKGLQFSAPVIMNRSQALEESSSQHSQRELPPAQEQNEDLLNLVGGQRPRDLDDIVKGISSAHFISDEENATRAFLRCIPEPNERVIRHDSQIGSQNPPNNFVQWYAKAERNEKRKKYAAVGVGTLLLAMIVTVLVFTGGYIGNGGGDGGGGGPQPPLVASSATRSVPPRPSPPSPPDFNPNNVPIKPPSTETWTEYSLKVMLEAFSHSSDLENASSAQGNALKWLSDSNLEYMDSARVQQRYVLAVLYFSLQAEKWADDNGWLSSDHECTWYGVKCGSDGSSSFPVEGTVRRLFDDGDTFMDVVTSISLSDNNMHGKLPEELKYLSFLVQLILSGNFLEGSIPKDFLAEFHHIHTLYLNENFFTGQLPDEFNHMDSLRNLDLSGNSFAGTIPSTFEFADDLVDVRLSNNLFNGEIPDVFSAVTNLSVFLAGNNEIVGSIPKTLAQLTNLVALQIYENELQGSIPAFVSKKLEQIHLDNNQLTGSLEALTTALLKEVRFEGNKLSGNIPVEVGLHTNLKLLWLNGNQLTGTVPNALGQLERLDSLRLDGNLLKGFVPNSICSLKSDHELSSFRATCSGTNPDLKCDCCDSC